MRVPLFFKNILQLFISWFNKGRQMNNDDLLMVELRVDEDTKPLPYKDSEDIWTVATGRNIQSRGLPIQILVDVIRRAGGLQPAEMEFMLRLDVVLAKEDLNNLYPGWINLSPVRQRVLINMMFNMGMGVFRRFYKFWTAVKRGNIEEAAKEMEDSKWFRQVGPRAKRLQKMWRNG